MSGLRQGSPAVTLARLAMRTRFEIVLADEDDPARLRAAGEEALDEIERVESLLSVFRDDAELFHVNAHAAHQPMTVDVRLMEFLRRAADLCAATAGAFDPAIGALLACWKQPQPSADGSVKLPTPEAISTALTKCGMRQRVMLDVERCSVRFSGLGVQLDPGAIGKGYALERATDLLRYSGISTALLHGGTSTVCAIGHPAAQPAWTVAIQDPVQADRHIATASLVDTSLSVSAVHGRSFTANGKRYGHVIDPRSGWPVQGNLLAAVIHPSAMTSDALSTALLVLGVEGLHSIAVRFPTAGLLLVREGTGPGTRRTDVVGSGFTTHPGGMAHGSPTDPPAQRTLLSTNGGLHAG